MLMKNLNNSIDVTVIYSRVGVDVGGGQERSQGVCKGCPGKPLGEKNGWRGVQG